MSIAVMKMPMPPKSSPSRSSELRKALVRIKADTDEAVLLFPDENATLAKLRNRASGAVAAVRDAEGTHFITRTTKAVNPGNPEASEPETCVGIWKVSQDPNADKAEARASGPAKQEAKPANGKASKPANGKPANGKADPEESKQGVLDSLS